MGVLEIVISCLENSGDAIQKNSCLALVTLLTNNSNQ